MLLKRNVNDAWWQAMLGERDDIVALDSAIIQHPKTWEASGHLAGFTDPLVDCKTCGQRFRADHLDRAACGRKPSKHPGETPDCDLTEAREFNLMFETTIGPVKEAGATVYLRPETAQGIFLNFKNVLQFARKKPPFGIAQVGKSFRNEITPGNFVFRTLEFEQMEMEFFVPPDEAQQWYEHWLKERLRLVHRPRHPARPPASCARTTPTSSATTRARTSDVEYLFPIGWSELEGIANRGDFDLHQHAEHSRREARVLRPRTRRALRPPRDRARRRASAARCSRSCATPTTRRRSGASSAPLLRLHPRLAPVKVAVLPLVRKDGQPELAREVFEALRGQLQAEYDEGGSIGKRYRRQDEIGTPFVRDDRPPVAGGPHGHRPRPRLARAGARGRRRAAGRLGARLAAPWRSPKLDG